MKRLLIIGAGYCGGTAYNAFKPLKNWEISACDRREDTSYLAQNLLDPNELLWKDVSYSKEVDLVFVCTPTPMDKDTGECYTSIVESVVKEVRKYSQSCWICIKSTIPPGTTQKLHEKYCKVCFNPEFLTEANAFTDFRELPYQILGYPEVMPGITDSLDNPLEGLYKDAFEQHLVMGGGKILSMTSTQAEMVKYTRNCYLATRISYFNEIKQVCDKLDIDYRQMKFFAGLDSRVGHHYNEIDESEPEFSLSCLPKDLNGLAFLGESLGIEMTMLRAVWEKNLQVAKKKTWEKMEKAVI